MRAMINVLYFWLGVLWISTVENEYNLYNTDRNSLLCHDCFRYVVNDEFASIKHMPGFKSPYQIITYCLRPIDNETESNELVKGNFSTFRFDELNMMNVTAQDLIRWSVSFDLAEDYQEYLDTGKPIFAEKVLNNCSHKWFGSYCEYIINGVRGFGGLVTSLFFEKEFFSVEPSGLICYTQLKCDRCLDWREICDGKIDCPIDGADEENCFDLEMNECAENEYRCQNGLCVPETFVNDSPYNPDCLDSTDEQANIVRSFRATNYIGCHRDPSFRCEETHYSGPLGNFPCGDGQASVIFQGSCVNERDKVYFQTFFTFEKNLALSFDCWFILNCATGIANRGNEQCQIFCKSFVCEYDLADKCDSAFVIFPQHVIIHDHIRFGYLTNKTIHRRRTQQLPSLPDYVCYDARRCPFLTPTLYINGSACKLTTELNVSKASEIDLLFRTCPIEYRNSNLTNFPSRSLFQCPGTTKFISKHRLLDGIPDCYEGVDENNVDACSLNHRHRFKCRSENKCISRIVVYNSVQNCLGGEDEILVIKKLISFQELCNGFVRVNAELIDNQNETDETNCEEWPCNNMYTRCNKAWSCLNGADESNCLSEPCSPNRISCISPYNFTLICLPISRANDGKIDCLGSSDERSYCRHFGYQAFPYRCWNDSTCVDTNFACHETGCPFSNIKTQCRDNIHLQVIFESMVRDVKMVFEPLGRYFTIIGTETVLYPTNIRQQSTLIKHIVRRELVLHETSAIGSILNKLDQWNCNRGIPIEVRNKRKYRCFCPPSYYGHHCQFQSQRVSLTLQLQKICAPSCLGVFGIIVTLIDDEYFIHSQEQFTYISTDDCNKKFNIYLLYDQRSKDLNKTYAIRVNAYNKTNMYYHASWIIPVNFAFLPVNRISALLTLPAASVTFRCSKFCTHGQCLLYVNTGKEFCLCDSGWSGEECTISLNCNCSPQSLCLGVIHNRSTCLCPLHKTGPRCFLSSICQLNVCSSEEICIANDNDQKYYKCLCQRKFFGDGCEYTLRFEISFSQIIIPQAILAHFITAYGDSEPQRMSTTTKIKQDQDEAIFYVSNPFLHLLFIQIHHEYYIGMLHESGTIQPITKITIYPSRRCPHIRELINKQISSFPFLRRVKSYHMICRQRFGLSCFHDEETFMCLCTTERHANCFHFDFNMTYDCQRLSDCKNGAQCFQDSTCSSWIKCMCPDCFYGSKCQFTTKGFGLSLDAILGYSIRPHVSLTHQSTPVKVSIAVTVSMLVVGLINGVMSIMTFRVKNLREVGCGNYLLALSIISLLVIIVFTFKFVFFLLSQMLIITNHTFLYINCISIDFLLRSLLAVNDWLNASIAIERALVAIKATSFNKKQSRQVARFIIFVVVLVAFGSNVHDPIYRQLVEDEEDERMWCIIQYHSFQLELLNLTMNVLHFILPFTINLVSALLIIITAARQRASTQKQISYKQHLREQWHHHNHLIFSPIVLIALAVPRLIISFFSGCMKSAREPWLFLACYFISFVPPLLTILIYILPSKTYKKQFVTLLKQYRTALSRLMRIE